MSTSTRSSAGEDTIEPAASRRWRRGLVLAAVLILGGLFAWQLVENPAHEEPDITQERLDKAAPPLLPGLRLEQTFYAAHDGLKAVEVTLVRYQPDATLPDDAEMVLELYGRDDDQLVARSTLRAAGTQHNQRLRFTFPPLADSEGRDYRLVLTTNGDHALSFWTCASEAYAGTASASPSYAAGELLFGGQRVSGDLVFTTIYDYHLTDVLGDAARLMVAQARALPGILLLLLLPGLAAWCYVAPRRELDAGTALAVILAVSLSFWPLALLWLSVAKLRLNGWLLWLMVGGLLAAMLVRIWRPGGDGPRGAPQRDPWPELALGFILLFSLVTRLLQVRELLVPAWVDSLHHTLITQLIVEQGLLPSSYQPYLPVADLHYHFGFHANAAVLCWLSGLAPHQAVLLLGQVLNAAAVFGVYALASHWSGERWAGVGAALVTSALSYMPSYYVSWGRYTQLAGLVILPSLCLVAGWLLEARERRRNLWGLAVLLGAGLALTHYRVIVFFALFWLCRVALYWLQQRAGRQALRQGVVTSLWLLGLCAVALAPWAMRFIWRVAPAVGATYGGMFATAENDNTFPTGLLKVGWTQGLLWVAAAGALWSWVRRKGELGQIPFWCALCFVAANLHWLGLPDVWLIHNQSVVISFWLPVSVLCGWLFGEVVHWWRQATGRWQGPFPWTTAMATLLLVVVVTLGAWRSWWLVDTVNRVTILVTADDLAAIAWLDEHLPPDARILVNSRKWQGELRVGTDAGYWIPLLAKRQTTMPAVVYYQGTPAYREGVDALARVVEDAESLDDPLVVQRLVEAGITHVFVGARGGKLEPKLLDSSPHFVERFARGAARVYEFRPEIP